MLSSSTPHTGLEREVHGIPPPTVARQASATICGSSTGHADGPVHDRVDARCPRDRMARAASRSAPPPRSRRRASCCRAGPPPIEPLLSIAITIARGAIASLAQIEGRRPSSTGDVARRRGQRVARPVMSSPPPRSRTYDWICDRLALVNARACPASTSRSWLASVPRSASTPVGRAPPPRSPLRGSPCERLGHGQALRRRARARPTAAYAPPSLFSRAASAFASTGSTSTS